MYYRGFVQVCKLSHIIRFIKLRRIDPINLVNVHLPLLLRNISLYIATGVD